MRKFIISMLLALFINSPAFCTPFVGGVEKAIIVGGNKVIDSQTGEPITGAKITLPLENYNTFTDGIGQFALDANIDGKTVVSIEKAGYKPFSMTIDRRIASKPIVLEIEKATPKDITIDTEMFHIGDNNYSDNSANAKEFQVQSVGPFYSKTVFIPHVTQGTKTALVIGSIIGIDTKMAKQLGQNKITNAYASPPEVYFNGHKIADIQVNGDSQRIKVPYNLIKQNQNNEITIKTGRNLMQTAYVDYDDIEFMNLSIETN